MKKGCPARPKPEPLKPRVQDPGVLKPESPHPGKKRNHFLTGALIVFVLAIVVAVPLWATREPQRRPGPIPAESPEAKAPSQRTSTNSIGMSFVLIPAGSFAMGSPAGEPGRNPDERQHPVTISKPFYLQTTEVTQKQWTQVMGNNPSSFKDCGHDCPVETVSWNDAQDFIKKLNHREPGAKYRLPTEAEWEYACRAGSKGRFCFGDENAKLGEYAWYGNNSDRRTHPVGKKKPNTWGLYDMHGNLWEWCQDWYGEYSTSQVTDPTGPEAGEGRVFRGGSWGIYANHVRSASRNGRRPGYRHYYLGFRAARDL